ncbi:MAG: hypothetical protein R2697_20920 [Ilumatobacteraceae bacterium]
MRLSQDQIVSYRVRVNGLDRRAALDDAALSAATHVGVQDSMPRAAVLSLHARLDGVSAEVLDDATRAGLGPPLQRFRRRGR